MRISAETRKSYQRIMRDFRLIKIKPNDNMTILIQTNKIWTVDPLNQLPVRIK